MRYLRRSSDPGTRLLLVAVLIGGALGPAIADQRTINAMGDGVEPWKAWLEVRKDGYSAGYGGDWLLGYLTGVNLWGPTSCRLDDIVWKRGTVFIDPFDHLLSILIAEQISAAAN